MDSTPKLPNDRGVGDPATLAAPLASVSLARVAGGGAEAPIPTAQLLERTSQPFLSLNLEGRITFTNRAFEKLVGLDAAELRRLTIYDLTPARWHPTSEAMLARIREDGGSLHYEKEYRHKDGHLVAIAATVDLDRDEQGAARGYFAFVTDISERKQVEVALRDSEARFRRLYDEAPVGYHEIDTEGRIVNINRTECEMLGYSREEIVGRPVFDFLADEDRDEAKWAFPEKIRGNRPLRALERTLLDRQGNRLLVSIEERYKRDDQGAIVGIRSTVQDVTERKRTEAALIASERRARALFEGIQDAVFVHSADGLILDANPASCRLLGYAREELLRMRTVEIDEPEFAEGYEGRLADQLRTGHLTCEGRHRTKDGRIIPVEINTSTIQFDDQLAVLAVIRDITERKTLEATRRQLAEAQLRNAREMEEKNRALTASEARYRRLTEGCLDAVIVADRRGTITLFNPAAENIFGYASGEVNGASIALLMPEEFGDLREMGFEGHLQARRPGIVGRTVELRGRRKDESVFPLELSLSAIDFAGERQFIGSVRDQTERHRMRAMLAQTEKLASIGLLSAGVAHEINNPLAYVANNLAVLERDMKSILDLVARYESARDVIAEHAPDALRRIDELVEELDWAYVRDNLERMLARTREGVQRVANIVQNLRGLARTSPPKMEPASIPDLFESAIEMVRGRLRRHQIEVVAEHGDLPQVVCVAPQISQVILNLLINASQAIESTGRGEGGVIRFVSRLEGDMATLEIHDNGCGIPAESIPQLFDPFYTTKPVGEGTGLGLSISHGIVTGHGGRIDVESREGEGTCFRVRLPLKPT